MAHRPPNGKRLFMFIRVTIRCVIYRFFILLPIMFGYHHRRRRRRRILRVNSELTNRCFPFLYIRPSSQGLTVTGDNRVFTYVRVSLGGCGPEVCHGLRSGPERDDAVVAFPAVGQSFLGR